MARKRCVTFYKICWRYCIPYVEEYWLVCSRSYLQCLKLGFRHLRKGNAHFFRIEKKKPKKH